MKPNCSTIIFMVFTGKTKVLNYQCRLENCFIFRADSIKGLDVNIDYKLHFPHDHFFHV
jgi:hypothetical protein